MGAPINEKDSGRSEVHIERVEHDSTTFGLSPDEEKRLYRKLDLKLMPILSLMYLLAFMDRGNIGNAKLEGLLTQLKMTGSQYNIALIMFFIPYCLSEPPANLVLKLFRPSIWLPLITLAWGIVMTLMGLVKTYPQLVGVRICLGVCEAGLFPGVVYFLTHWYPRYHMQYRIGLFFGAATVAGAFSGLLAWGIAHMSGVGGLLGWSWIFILEGLATVLVAGLSAIVLRGCDSPEEAKWLTEKERAFIVQRQKYDNSSVGEDTQFQKSYVWAAVLDWQVWVNILIYMSVDAPLYACALFLPSIINGFGYSRAISQLLTVPPFVFGTIILLVLALFSDRTKKRGPFIIIGQLMAFVGFAINISNVPRGPKYFGMFLCVAGSYGAFPAVVALMSNNLAPNYKRGVGMAMHIGIGNFAGAFSAAVYRAQDSPRYIPGHAMELAFLGMGLILTPLTMWIYTRINANRDAKERERIASGKEKLPDEEIRRLGDRAPDFRYSI